MYNALLRLMKWPAVVTVGLTVAMHVPAAAQNQGELKGSVRLNQPVEIKFKQSAMAAILRDLSQRYGVSVIADGVPLLQSADLEFRGSLREALDRIADTFDYTITIRKTGIVSMMKRFKNPEERPQVIPAEMRQTATDMLTILPVFPYDVDEPPLWARMIRQLAPQLTPEQIDGMKQGKTLMIADLAPKFQQMMAEIIQLRAYGVTRSMWEQLYRQLDRFDSSILRARKRGVFTFADNGKSTASYAVMHETRSGGGAVTATTLGEFQREVKP